MKRSPPARRWFTNPPLPAAILWVNTTRCRKSSSAPTSATVLVMPMETSTPVLKRPISFSTIRSLFHGCSTFPWNPMLHWLRSMVTGLRCGPQLRSHSRSGSIWRISFMWPKTRSALLFPTLVLVTAESFKTVTRHPARVRIKTGVTKEGKLVARECLIYMETGAYADAGPRVTQKAGYRCFGPYRIPNIKTEAYTVYTNTVPAGAYRGFGTLQVTWAYESQMDMIAEKLKFDPVQFRLKNLLKKGELYTPGDTPVDCDLKEGLLLAAKSISWGQENGKPNRGKGLACCMKDGGGTYKVASAAVTMNSDGSIILLTGTVEIGQGARTALSQIVAEELGVPLSRITVAELDTDVTPYDVNTNASSSTVVMGLSVQRAAKDLKRQLLRHAAKVLKVT